MGGHSDPLGPLWGFSATRACWRPLEGLSAPDPTESWPLWGLVLVALVIRRRQEEQEP